LIRRVPNRTSAKARRYRASLASSARLYAEVNDLPLKFPPSLAKWPDLIADETRLYNSAARSWKIPSGSCAPR
jgi:adhesin transport system membrane fusion protein